MTLSSFIETHREQILEAWQRDAVRRVPGRRYENVSVLRDNLGELLEAIGRGLEAASRNAPAPGERAHTQKTWSHVEAVAAKHGAARAREGITLREVVPEFPALRSCVERLWRQSLPAATAVGLQDLEDLIRFDEAVDAALTQSVSEFMDRLNRSREMFLGILGHDLREPLSTILTAAKLMQEKEFDCSGMREMAGRIVGTGERMHQLVVDLVDFTRTRVAGQMPIQPHEVDLAAVIQGIAEEFKTVHPERNVRVHISGNLQGSWDDKRMGQAILNLLANAFQHGATDRPIDISASAKESEVAIAVHNEGPPIPKERREHLFEPLSSASRKGTGEDERSHLGLGLYIARAIVAGHRGSIDFESEPKRGTTFTCHLPKGGAPPESQGSGAAKK